MAPVEKSHRPGLEAIARRLAESKTLYRRNQEGRIKRVSPSAVTSIPLAALKAIAVVHQSELRGGEIDMRIPIAGRSSTVPVSVIMEMSGRVLFEIAKTPRTQVHRNSWTPRYKAGNKNWTAAQRRALRIAINQLNRQELRVLGHITLYRYGSAGKSKGALYLQQNCAAEIRIYDLSFESDRWTFSGSAYSPLPASTRTVLHEVGHAIHSRPGRYAFCVYDQNQRALKKRIDKYNAIIERTGGRIPTSMQAKMKSEQRAIADAKSKLDREFNRANAMVIEGPVLKASRRVLGNDRAPTRYGTTSTRESFAESFALFRADPMALKRLLPKVYRWFENNGHIRAIGERNLGKLPWSKENSRPIRFNGGR